MTVPVEPFANDDDAAQYWLNVLRDGDEGQRLHAREQLAAIFERRGMFEEATELLISNIHDGVRSADIFRWLARLYRNQGQEMLAMQAAAEAAKYMPPAPVPLAVPVVQASSVAAPTSMPARPYAAQQSGESRAVGCFRVAAVVGFVIFVGVVALVMLTPSSSRSTGVTLTGSFTPVPQVRGLVMGGVYTLASDDYLWVERLGMDAWRRADNNHDDRGKGRIRETFEHFFPEAGTRVKVIVRDGNVRQLEILDGRYAGKRGWTDLFSDANYIP